MQNQHNLPQLKKLASLQQSCFPTRRKTFLPHTVTLQRFPLIPLFLSGAVNVWISEPKRLPGEWGTRGESSFASAGFTG